MDTNPNSHLTCRREFATPHDLDTFLVHAGYSVKASELAHVAQRLEQLESVLCAAQDAGILHLSHDAIHYNPSDLAGWIECMIGELEPASLPNSIPDYNDPGTSNSSTTVDQQSVIQAHEFKQSFPGPLLHQPSTVSSYGGSSIEDLEEFDQFRLGKLEHVPDTEVYPYHHDALHLASTDSMDNLSTFEEFHPCGAQLQPTKSEVLESAVASHTSTLHDQYMIKHHQPDRSYDYGSIHENQSNTKLISDEVLQCADQECGVRLVHLLMACAHAVQNFDLKLAHDMVNEIKILAYPETKGAMAKVAAFFVEALARRIYGINSPQADCLDLQQQADAFSDLLNYHFYEICPYLKFAHFTANQAILEAFQGQKFVHVIDFSLMQGLQWPALIQALALRAGGPPHLRLTGIGPPQPDNKDVLQEMGMKIAQFANSVNVEFDFRGIVAAKLDDVKPWMFHVQESETVAVNSVLQLHRLLAYSEDNAVAHTAIGEVLKTVRSLKPKVFTVVEQEADHNGAMFEDRFMQALQYYCTMFDSLEACQVSFQSNEIALAEMYLGREIMSIVAYEGRSRLERHETLCRWRKRMEIAGFRPLHLGSNAFKQARMLLNLFSGEGYTVQEDHGSLTLGWHSLPLFAASAWQCTTG